MLVTLYFEEELNFSVSVVTSGKPNISSELLLKFGGKLVPVSKLLFSVSVVLENSEVANDISGKEVEIELCGDREEAEEGKVFVGDINKEEAVPSGETGSDDTVFWNWGPGVVMSTLVISVLVNI